MPVTDSAQFFASRYQWFQKTAATHWERSLYRQGGSEEEFGKLKLVRHTNSRETLHPPTHTSPFQITSTQLSAPPAKPGETQVTHFATCNLPPEHLLNFTTTGCEQEPLVSITVLFFDPDLWNSNSEATRSTQQGFKGTQLCVIVISFINYRLQDYIQCARRSFPTT